MTYAQYLRKVRKEAARREWPWLCTCNSTVGGWSGKPNPHRDRLAHHIDHVLRQDPDTSFLPTALRKLRPEWAARLKHNGKRIRISWLTELIKAADAEAALAAK